MDDCLEHDGYCVSTESPGCLSLSEDGFGELEFNVTKRPSKNHERMLRVSFEAGFCNVIHSAHCASIA